MQDISGFGLRLNIRASVTFPVGFNVTQFADDADPFDAPDLTIRESAVGLNGDLQVWSTPNPIVRTVSVIPNSDDDRNLSTLLEANRAGRGKFPVQDVITITAIYPDGRVETYNSGAITAGQPGQSVASAGRQKSKTFTFVFENVTRA